MTKEIIGESEREAAGEINIPLRFLKIISENPDYPALLFKGGDVIWNNRPGERIINILKQDTDPLRENTLHHTVYEIIKNSLNTGADVDANYLREDSSVRYFTDYDKEEKIFNTLILFSPGFGESDFAGGSKEGIMLSHSELMRVMEQSPVSVIITGKEGNIRYVNPHFSKISGYFFEETAGRNPRFLKSGIHEDEFYTNLWKTISSGNTWQGEFCNRRKSGDLYWVFASITPIIDEDKKISGYVAVNEDITERKAVELERKKYIEELHQRKDELEKISNEQKKLNRKLRESEKGLKVLNASKDKFFSIIAHDLKSPLSALLGYSEFIQNDFDNLSEDEIKYFSGNIHHVAKSLNELLENLLQWSRLQTKRLKYSPEIINIRKISENVISIYKANALKKSITIVNKISNELLLWADENMVQTMMRNLLSNAIKFSYKSGEIIIDSEVSEKNIEVSVIDSGVGIGEEELKDIFNIARQRINEGTDEEKGTGLGLMLTKEMVEQNKGDIKIYSHKDQGTKIVISLPRYLKD